MHWSAAVLRPHDSRVVARRRSRGHRGCCRWWRQPRPRRYRRHVHQRPGPEAAQCSRLRRLSGWSRIRRTRLSPGPHLAGPPRRPSGPARPSGCPSCNPRAAANGNDPLDKAGAVRVLRLVPSWARNHREQPSVGVVGQSGLARLADDAHSDIASSAHRGRAPAEDLGGRHTCRLDRGAGGVDSGQNGPRGPGSARPPGGRGGPDDG